LIFIGEPTDSSQTRRTRSILKLGHQWNISGLILNQTWVCQAACFIQNDGLVTGTDGITQRLTESQFPIISQGEVSQVLHTLVSREAPQCSVQPTQQNDILRFNVMGDAHTDAHSPGPLESLPQKRLELLIYLALHREGVLAESVQEALWPGDVETAHRLHALVCRLRHQLVHLSNEDPSNGVICFRSGRYRLNSNVIEVDYWDFQDSLKAARNAVNTESLIANLRKAVRHATHPPSNWPPAEWAESWLETIRREASSTLSRLASLLQDREPESSISLLERAIQYDPYNEEIYQRTIRIQARIGRPAEARNSYQHLKQRLHDIDTEPSTASLQALNRAVDSRG
jgi:DNA-binding SARP family transcriptional activator